MNRGARTAGAQDGEGGGGGYGRQVESPLHNRQKGQIDIMPRSNRAGRAISVIVTVYSNYKQYRNTGIDIIEDKQQKTALTTQMALI